MIISDVNLIHSQSSRLYVISSEIKKTLINGTIASSKCGLTQNRDQWHIRHNRRSPRRTSESPSQRICDNLVIILLSFVSWQQTARNGS